MSATTFFGRFCLLTNQRKRTIPFQYLIFSGKTREVRHLQYLAWPDHGVPLDSASFLAFALEVRRAHTTAVPLVVHCSAGVGRAGTFLAAHTQMTQYNEEGFIDIPEGKFLS